MCSIVVTGVLKKAGLNVFYNQHVYPRTFSFISTAQHQQRAVAVQRWSSEQLRGDTPRRRSGVALVRR